MRWPLWQGTSVRTQPRSPATALGRRTYLTAVLAAAAAAAVAGASACVDLDLFEPIADVAALRIITGSGQTGAVNTRLPVPLTVRATDADGRPIRGVTIEYSETGLTHQGDLPGSSTTDGDGIAAAPWVLGSVPGEQYLRACTSVLISPRRCVTFAATVTAPPKARASLSHRASRGSGGRTSHGALVRTHS